MANFGKLPYEISIWEDTILDDNGNVLSYFREKKIAVIASDTMDTPIMAFDKDLKEKINGSSTLTFKLYYKYNEGNGLVDNPFIPFMVNERKVKLLYKNKTYDFIIKDIKENSSDYTFSYTCEDAHIVELSKNGFNLEFAPELNNNQGTAIELGSAVVEDTNWTVISNTESIIDDNGNTIRSDCIIQETKEALFEFVSSGIPFPVYTMSVSDQYGTQISNEPTTITLSAGTTIYVFYSTAMSDVTGADIQFIYNSNGQYTVDSERNITNGQYYLIRNANITRSAATYGFNINYNGARLFTIGNVSEQYRGIRYVISKKTLYDPLVDKYVDVYKDINDNKLVNVYTEIKTDARENILNCVSNYKKFESTSGWSGGSFNNDNSECATVQVVSAPDLINTFANSVGNSQAIQNVDKYIPLVRIEFPNTANSVGFNSGPWDVRSQIKSYSAGQKYHCILRAIITNDELSPTATGLGTLSSYTGTIRVASYSLNNNGAYVINQNYLTFNSFEVLSNSNGQYIHADAVCEESLNETATKNTKIGIFFTIPSGRYIYLEECWIYKEVVDEYGDPIIATAQPDYKVTINTRYHGYKPVDNSDVTDKEDISWCCEANSDTEFLDNYGDYKLQTNDDSVKILSITAKESNYFNLIQSICETFECWARFTVLHNADGSIKFVDGKPCKYITFHKYVGQKQYAGFRYGVNLNSISRSLVSSQIVTKLIVKSNKNEYAPNGFCAVGLAPSNPTRQNSLFNFDNYINTGLLDENQLYVDLWDDTNGIGYYKVISQASKEYDELTEKIEDINSILYPIASKIEEARVGLEAARQQIKDSEEICINKFKCEYGDFLKGLSERYDPTYEPEVARLPFMDFGHLMAWCAWNRKNLENVLINGEIRNGYYDSFTSEKETKAFITSITELQNACYNYEEILREEGDPPSLYMQYLQWKQELEELEEERAQKVIIIQNKDKEFYNKYYRYIQEGTWVNESYVDHEKYYLDAVSVLYNSCQPQVSYDVKVIDLAALDEYKGYECHLGDKTYIEDTEFFGYVLKDGVKTPYQEEIVITELNSVLDNPSKNSIKVQTKKTQFQDLFHRITATVQSVNYSTGAYDRAADMASGADLSINPDFLQASFEKNAIRLGNAANQTVIIDEKGITTTDGASPNNIVRIIGGGIYVSRDGGLTWEIGISAEDGINTRLLQAGQINTATIQIFDGATPAFRWDSNGISAYYLQAYSGEGPDADNVYGYDYTKAMRFDQYGIYGFQDLDSDNFHPTSSEDIMNDEHVKVALTWKGFVFRHTSGANNSIEIGSLDNNEHYGIVIAHDGTEVFRADELGNVSITGEIKANSGRLSDWIIGNGGISYSVGNSSVKLVPPNGNDLTDNVLEFSYNGNVKFAVDGQGNVTAGNIIATGGTIGGCTIENGTLIIQDANVDSINGIDIGKIKATVDSPPVSWPSEIIATKLTVSGNGTSKIANWKVKGNKLYNGIDTLDPSSGSGVCLDAGDSDDPSGVTIYEDSNNYFKFDTSNGLRIKSSDINGNQLYLDNGSLWISSLRLEPNSAIRISALGGSTALNFISYGNVDLTTSTAGTVTIAANKFLPGGNNDALKSLGESNNRWNLYASSINASGTSTLTHIKPDLDNMRDLGDSDYFWRAAYIRTVYNTSDFRLKRNINPLSNKYLSFFNDIEIMSYEFTRESSARTHIGVIAQDVDAALAKNGICNFAGVTHDEAVDKYYVSYNDISMLHMAHYKQFLKSNEARVALLEAKISKLEEQIQNLLAN